MKKIVFVFLLFVACSVGMAKEYSSVVEVEGKSAKELYSAARVWFAEKFGSAKEVLQMDDPALGKLIGKGHMDVEIEMLRYNIEAPMFFMMKVEVKSGKYRCVISDVKVGKAKDPIEKMEEARTIEGARKVLKAGGRPNPGKKLLVKVSEGNKRNLVRFENAISGLQESLRVAMVKKVDDW